MIDLYELIEKQNSVVLELDDDTELVLSKDTNGNWSASWHKQTRGGDEPMPSHLQYVYQGKSARIAITAALQARYPE